MPDRLLVQRGDAEELLVLDRGWAIDKMPATVDGNALRRVLAAELAAAGTWITDWLRLLPVITATPGLLPKHLLRAASTLVRAPVAPSPVEHAFAGAIQALPAERYPSRFAPAGCWHRA